MNYDDWINNGINNNYNFILILKDLEDLQEFPVYFYLELDLIKYKKNIISESKLKIIKIIQLNESKK